MAPGDVVLISLGEFLKARVRKNQSKIPELVNNIPRKIAYIGSRIDWPEQNWGVGQNGSIAGIVYHLALWKQLTLPALTGGELITLSQADLSQYPSRSHWRELVDWHDEVSYSWRYALDTISEEELDKPVEWEGKTYPLYELVSHIIDHDIQHLSQIEYLLTIHGGYSPTK